MTPSNDALELTRSALASWRGPRSSTRRWADMRGAIQPEGFERRDGSRCRALNRRKPLRYLLVVASVVAFSFSGVRVMSSGQRPTTPNAAAADVAALEMQFAQALVKADVEVLGALVDDDWIIIGPDGGITGKSAFLEVVRSGALTHSTMEFDDTRVRVYGDTAIVTARAVTTGAYQGHAFTTRERSTDIFVRKQGVWKCVLTQLTTIPTK